MQKFIDISKNKNSEKKGIKHLLNKSIVLLILFLLLILTNIYLLGNQISKQEKAAIHLNLALLHRSNMETEKAIAETEKAIRIYPKYDLAYASLADIYFQLGEFEKSLKNYDKALSFKKDPEYYYDKAAVYQGMGMLEEALNQYKKVIELDPMASNTLLAIANTLLDLGRFSESKPYYDKVLELIPNSPNIHNDIGLYYEKTGDKKRAVEEYQTALQLDPDHALAGQNLERLIGD